MPTPTRPAALLAAAALALLAVGGVAGCDLDEPRPNVFLVVLDTVRADHRSTSDPDRRTTPRLAELAREGVNFRRAWSPSSWTAPAHATLFTGLGPASHGLHMSAREYLASDTVTLAQRMRDAGYDTAGFSDNDNVGPERGLSAGFAHFERVYAREDVPAPRSREVLRRAERWLAERRDAERPFLVFLNLCDAHLPYTPTASAQEVFGAMRRTSSSMGRGSPKRASARRPPGGASSALSSPSASACAPSSTAATT